MKNLSLYFLLFFSLFLANCHTRPTVAARPGSESSSSQSSSESDSQEAVRALSAKDFYSTWSGHKREHLEALKNHLARSGECDSIIYLAGDSSLDNKHWLFDDKSKTDDKSYERSKFCGNAISSYKGFLNPSHMIKDVNYWLGKQLEGKGKKVCPIMTSVEATTLIVNGKIRDYPQDQFIRENITENDYLIVSVGGNDVIMAPTDATIAHLTALLHPLASQQKKAEAFAYLKTIFKDRVQEYILSLTGGKKLKGILVSTSYFPDHDISGWAKSGLTKLTYNTDNGKKTLKGLIRKIYTEATSQIKIDGVNVVPVPLFEKMDGTDTDLYENAVEPSVKGGKVMAKFFLEKLGLL